MATGHRHLQPPHSTSPSPCNATAAIVNLVMDKIANRPRGFAFLRYAMAEESKKAIEGMHGKFLEGRVIFVEVAKSRSELREGLKQEPGESWSDPFTIACDEKDIYKKATPFASPVLGDQLYLIQVFGPQFCQMKAMFGYHA